MMIIDKRINKKNAKERKRKMKIEEREENAMMRVKEGKSFHYKKYISLKASWTIKEIIKKKKA